MESKECVTCGRAFARPLRCGPREWSTRRFCSVACSNRDPAKPRRSDRATPPTKVCAVCGQIFARSSSYPRKQWETKRYCSIQCAGTAQRQSTDLRRPPGPCPVCGQTFRKRYEAQRTCGAVECRDEYRRTVTGPQASERIRADYAAGRRQPPEGKSRREKTLWEFLAPLGWAWQLRWTDERGHFELDFALIDERLNVEVDGVEHREPRGRARDELRDAALMAAGWRILRIGNHRVDADPQGVLDEILNWATTAR